MEGRGKMMQEMNEVIINAGSCDGGGNGVGNWLLGGWKASYTVEASFMVPILIGTMVIAMRMGIRCYEEIRQQNEHEAICTMWEVKEFYKYQMLKEIVDD